MVTLARKALRLPADYVALDLETTGFSPARESITEIGAVKIRGSKIVDRFSCLVNPMRSVPSRVTKITGITNAMLEGQPTIDTALPEFIEWLEGDVLVGHNLRFDISFLSAASDRVIGHSRRFQMPTFDTMQIDKQLFPTERHRLLDLIQRYGIDDVEEHRALSDATQTYQCLEWQRRYIRCGTSAVEAELVDEPGNSEERFAEESLTA